MADEQVRFDIIINAKAAIAELKEMSKASGGVEDKVDKFSRFLVSKSKEWNVPIKTLLGTFRELNDEMSKQHKQTIFGNTGGKNVFDLSEQFLQSAQAAGRFQTTANGVVTTIGKVADATNKAGQATQRASGELEIFGNRLNLIRTAFGTLLAMGIFQFFSALSGAFSTAINNLREFEATLYRISNVERELSIKGVEISVAGIRKGIAEIKELLPIFSEEDISQMVGSLATATSHLGLSEKQILDLAKAIGILNIQSVEEETLLQTQAKVVNAIVTSQSKGVGNLGLTFSKTRMEAEAMRLGFLEAGEALTELTDKERTQVKLAIVLDKADLDSTEALGGYLESVDAKTQELSATWNDFLKNVAIQFAPTILEFLQSSITLIQNLNESLEESKEFWTELAATIAGVTRVVTEMQENKSDRTGAEKLFGVLAPGAQAADDLFEVDVINTFNEGFDDAIKNAEEFGKVMETATGNVEDFGEAAEEVDLTEFSQKIEDIIEDTQNAREDLSENLTRKLDDLNEEYIRKALDAETDYLRKVDDINRDYERDLEKTKAKHREQDLRDEEKYQLQLWELRMRFLMDLEDALHARDARQVIRLQKQYNLDKEALRRKHELEGKERESGQAAELEDAKRKRDERLADARLDYEQKLADQRLAKQRELEDLNVWYAREQADIEEAQKRKMETLLKGWVDEKKITEANAAEVYNILRSYFGPGGLTDQLYQYMMNSLVASTQNAVAAGLASMSSVAPSDDYILRHPELSGTSTPKKGGGSTSGRGRAEGGTLIATRPTTVTFGERGDEVASFFPLNKIGLNEGKTDLYGSLSGKGMDGMLRVYVDLSPGLEGRIIEKSMDGVGEMIEKINGTKL